MAPQKFKMDTWIPNKVSPKKEAPGVSKEAAPGLFSFINIRPILDIQSVKCRCPIVLQIPCYARCLGTKKKTLQNHDCRRE